MSDGEVLTTDGPFAESKEHLGGFYIIEADDLDAALAWASKTTAAVAKPIEVRPFRTRIRGLTAARHRRHTRARRGRGRPDLPRGVRPIGGRPDPRLRRHRRRRGRGTGGVRRRAAHVADATACRPTQAAGSRRPPAIAPSTACAARLAARNSSARWPCSHPRRRSRPSRGSGTRAGRPASPHLHLLPPGTLDRGTGSAHAPTARRPDDQGGRTLLPCHRTHDGDPSRTRQAQDQGRADPLPRPRGARAARPACARCSPSSTSIYTAGQTSQAEPGLCAEAIRLARILATLMPDEPEVAGLLALLLLTESRRASRTRPDGCLVLLGEQDRTRWDRALIEEGQAIVRRCLRRNQPGPVSAPGRHQRRARGRSDTRSRPTGRRSSPCTTSCSRSPPRRSSHSTARSPSARCRAPPPRSRWLTSWTWATTTRSTPRAPICSGGSAGTRGRGRLRARGRPGAD